MEVQRVIAALLVRLLPGAQAIDGVGGDDGADVIAPVEDGVEVFEIKSFARRLTTGHKRQIKDSLQRARDSRPEMTKWTLAVPLDPSPAEERWLTGQLQPLVNVPVKWMGLTQLEAALAEHPHIAREFWPGSAERRAVDLLSGYHQEQAALGGGVPDAIERGQKLRRLLGEVDPDFDFDIQLSDGRTAIGVRPRDDQALKRRPIGGTLTFEAPPGSPELDKITDFLTYGVALELDAPFVSATVRGLPGGLDRILDGTTTTGIQVGPATTPPRSGRLSALAGGSVVKRLPVVVTESTSGVAGGIRVVAEDNAKVLRVEMRMAPDGIHGDSSFSLALAGKAPDVVTAPASFLAALGGSDAAQLDVEGQLPIRLRITDNEAIVSSGIGDLVRYVETWNRVQDACGASITLPDLMTAEDADLLEFLDELVVRGCVQRRWPGGVFEVPPEVVEGMLARLLPRLNARARSSTPVFHVAGRTLALPGAVAFEVNRALVTNALALARALPRARSMGLPLLVQVQADGQTESRFVRET